MGLFNKKISYGEARNQIVIIITRVLTLVKEKENFIKINKELNRCGEIISKNNLAKNPDATYLVQGFAQIKALINSNEIDSKGITNYNLLKDLLNNYSIRLISEAQNEAKEKNAA